MLRLSRLKPPIRHSSVFTSNWTVRCLAAFCVVLLASQAFAVVDEASDAKGDTNAGTINVSRLRLGLGERGRVGSWIPIRLEAGGLPVNSPVRLVVTASDARGNECADTVASVMTDARGSVAVYSVFMTGRLDGNIRLQLVGEGDKSLWEHYCKCEPLSDFTLPNTPAEIPPVQSQLKLMKYDPISFVTVGIPLGLAPLANELASAGATNDKLSIASLESLSELPDSRRGLDSVDFIYLVDGYDISEYQQRAIEEWVTTGGHFLVSCGADLPQLLKSPVGRWLQPVLGIESNLLSTQDLSALQNFVAGSSQLQTYRNNVPVVKLRSNQAWSVVDSINGPLVQRVSYGAGLVTVVAVDLNRKPVNQWLSLPQLYETLIFSRQLDTTEGRAARAGRISSTGVSDLATQLAAVSDAVPSADRWSTWSVMLLIVLFLVVIGPLDYLLVVHLCKKPHLTWLTFPCLIVLFCLLAVRWVGNRDEPIMVRQVHLLDIAQPMEKQSSRIRTWSSISAADSGYISVTSKHLPIHSNSSVPATAAMQPDLAWYGRPEDVFGGLYREGGVSLGRQTSHRSEHLKEQESGFSLAPVLADGSSPFLSESFEDLTSSPIVESNLRVPPNGMLEGEFTHHLAAPIQNWIVVFGNRVFRPSRRATTDDLIIKPGKPWSIDSRVVSVSDLREFLKGVRVPVATASESTTATPKHIQIKSFYDTQGTNPLDILMMVSLYDVPGESFVKLQNHALRRDEISDSLYLNTVLVMGSVDLPMSELLVNGNAVVPVESQSVVRFLLPVLRTENTTPAPMAQPNNP